MATVREIVDRKGSHVLTIAPRASVFEAAVLMNEHRIGALAVLEGGRLVGMFTERDILQRIVAQQRDAQATPVHEVMTTEVACCRMHTSIEEARSVMKNRRIRHLPVIEDDRLVALISIGDLNAFEANSQELTIHFLEQYIYGQG